MQQPRGQHGRGTAADVQGVKCEGADGRGDDVDRAKDACEPRFQQGWRRGLEAIVVTEVADRFAKRDVNVDAVERRHVADRLARGALPHPGNLFLAPHHLRPVQVGEPRRIADTGDFQVTIVQRRAAPQPGLVAHQVHSRTIPIHGLNDRRTGMNTGGAGWMNSPPSKPAGHVGERPS